MQNSQVIIYMLDFRIYKFKPRFKEELSAFVALIDIEVNIIFLIKFKLNIRMVCVKSLNKLSVNIYKCLRIYGIPMSFAVSFQLKINLLMLRLLFGSFESVKNGYFFLRQKSYVL